jgi:chromosome segregation ATPase
MECIRHEKIIDEYEADIEGYQVDTETFETEIDEHEKKEKELQIVIAEHEKKEKELQMVIAEHEKKEKELQMVIAEQKKEIYNYEESINWDENEMINLKDENKKYEHLFTVLKKVVKICEPGYLGNYVSEIRNVLSEKETEETEISEELEILEETEISEGLNILEELEKTKKQVSYLENLIKTQQDLSKENKKQIKLYKKSSVAMSDKQ